MKWPRIHVARLYTSIYIYIYSTKKSTCAGQQLSHHYASRALTHEYSYSRVYIYIFPNFFIFLPFFLSFFPPPFNSLTGLETEKPRQNLYFVGSARMMNAITFSFFFFASFLHPCTRIHHFAATFSRWRRGGSLVLFVSR